MKALKILIGILLLLLLVFILGPKPDYPAIDGSSPDLKLSLAQIPKFVAAKDAQVESLKPGNQSTIGWADSMRQTDYSLLYLHGFSASPREGHPMIAKMAARYGMNYYAPLLAGHGSGTKESFLTITPQDWIADAAEALAIAKLLGKKIIVMSCSTGSTLAVYLSALDTDLVAAHVMYAPNLDLADQSSKVMSYPWGLQLAKAVMGSDYRSFTLSEAATPYWTTMYRIEGLQALRYLLDETMQTEIWEQFDDPYLIAYYYESPTAHDDIISIQAIDQFHEINKADQPMNKVAPLAEPKSHVIASPLQSKNTQVVEAATVAFLDQLMDPQVPFDVLEN